MSGLIVGGFAGVIRSSTPFLFALASGIQWFTLGTTFWGKWICQHITNNSLTLINNFAASRGIVLQVWGKDKLTPRDKITASAIAGGVGGTAGGLLRESNPSYSLLTQLIIFPTFPNLILY
jgi:hypothetical protein